MNWGGSSLPNYDYYMFFLYLYYNGLELNVVETYNPWEDSNFKVNV